MFCRVRARNENGWSEWSEESAYVEGSSEEKVKMRSECGNEGER